MDEENQDSISQMRAITISREYGSGGGEIASRLAASLGWKLIDHDVVVRVAQELGISEEEATTYDEHTQSLVVRILLSMQSASPTSYVNMATDAITDPKVYTKALRRVVLSAVTAGHVIIVGRGSQVFLDQRRDVLHVRIVAPLDRRIPYVMNRERLDYNAARARIKLKDRDRLRYLQEELHHHPNEPYL